MSWDLFTRIAILFGLLLSVAGCVSDQQACSGQADYWGCMNYYATQNSASVAAMSQAAASQRAVAAQPFLAPRFCGPYGCY